MLYSAYNFIKFIMFIKSWNPAGTWLIDNETVYPKNRIYCVDCQWFYSHFLFSFFFPSLSFDGSKASNIAKAGRSYGLEVKAHRYGVDEVKENVTYPAIIHWNFNHFVVLCGFTKNAAVINDPARGTIKVTMEEFDHSFTGVCIEFTPGENFEKGGKPESVFKFLKLKNSIKLEQILLKFIAYEGLVFWKKPLT